MARPMTERGDSMTDQPRRRARFGWTAALLATALAVPALAADHLDSPAVTAEPAADINDLYAFMAPADADKVVLVMTVFPQAGGDAAFSDAVNYTFHVRRSADGMSRDITCTFEADGSYSCAGPSGAVAAGTVGETANGDSIQAWTGLRDDPFFFDLRAFNNAVGADDEANPFCALAPEAGGNGDFFAGLNALAIVVEVRKEVLLQGEADNQVLSIWASTSRRGG
jgi:hypothetical protein